MDFLRCLRAARDPLRRFAWSRFKNCGLFTISAVRARPSAEIRVVEVQKQRTFYDFCGARGPSLCGDSRGRGSKTADILRLLRCARDPLRRFARSRLKQLVCTISAVRVVEVQRFKNCRLFTISAVRARPSAEIRMVKVQKLWTSYDFCKPRATLCGDLRGRGQKTEDLSRFLRAAREPLRGSCVSKRSRCGAVRICCSKWPLEVVSWLARLQSRGRGLDSPLVRGSSGLKIAAFKYRRSTRSVLLQLRLENRNF